MPLEIETQRLYKALKFIGANPKTGEHSGKIWIFLFIMTFVSVNATIYTIDEWQNVELRLAGGKAALHYWHCLSFLVVIIFTGSSIIQTLKTIEDPHFQHLPYPVSPRRQQLLDSIHSDVTRACKIWFYCFVSCAIAGLVLPVMFLIVTLFTGDVNNIDQLLLLNPFWYPEGYETFPVYCFAYVAENAYLVIACYFGYYCVSAPVTAMQLVVGELKLLRLSVEEIDDYLSTNKETSALKNTNGNEIDGVMKNRHNTHNYLKSVMGYIVEHHQYIYRKVADVNRGIKIFAFLPHITVSLYVCMTFYYAMNKMNDKSTNFQNAFISSMMTGQIFLTDYMGETIATQDENLRNAIYQTNWIERPEWFKSCLKIIMVRETKPIKMEAAGFLELNLKHFAMCVNAAYSYYNVINNLK